MGFCERGFTEITVHTAICDVCDGRNKSTMYRCTTSGRQVCTPCYNRERSIITHEALSPKETPRRQKKGVAQKVNRRHASGSASSCCVAEPSDYDGTLLSELRDFNKWGIKEDSISSLQMNALRPMKRRRVIVDSVDEDGDGVPGCTKDTQQTGHDNAGAKETCKDAMTQTVKQRSNVKEKADAEVFLDRVYF